MIAVHVIPSRVRSSALACGVALLLASLSVAAHANGPMVSYRAGNLVPLSTDRVRLLSERVLLVPRDLGDAEPGWLECGYVLVNLTERALDFPMSFVGGRDTPLTSGVPSDCRVAVRGLAVPIEWKAADPKLWAAYGVGSDDVLPVWSVRMAPRETLEVRIEHALDWDGGAEGESWYRLLVYHARPAALWAGTIAHARFEIRLGELETAFLRQIVGSQAKGPLRIGIEPSDVEWSTRGFTWTRRDWEPDTDFRFTIDWDDPQPEGE